MIEEQFEKLVSEFNERAKKDLKLQEKLKGEIRTIQLEFKDYDWFKLTLDDCELKDFGKGKVDAPDIRIITDVATMDGLLKKEIGPMKAWATRKLIIKASIEDILKIKSLF